MSKTMNTRAAVTKVNVYMSNGQWFGARWAGDEYDGCDALDVPDGAQAHEALASASLEFDGAAISLV